MATVDEILARNNYTAGDETWTMDNRYPSYTMYVGPEYVPVANKRIADFNDQVSVYGEQNTQFVGFQLPRYDDAMDLKAKNLYIHYQTAYGGSDSVPCNVSWSDGYVRICWMIPAQATQQPGNIQMMIYATGNNSVGERVVWKTLPASYIIHDGLDIGGGIPEPDHRWYEQFLEQMESQVETARGHADDARASKADAASSATASAKSAAESTKALEDNKDYVESQKAAFVGYSRRETDSRYANALTGTGSGTAQVTVENAWEVPLINLDIAGKSEQVVTTGAQLFDAAAHTFTAGKCVGFNDGAITSSDNYKCIQEYIPFTGYGQKNLTLNHRPGAGYAYAGMAFYDEDKKFISGGKGAAIWVREETAYMRFTVDESVEPETIMINTGNTSLPWEPYTGGRPSPSPEYPQPIISTGTVGTGAQLFDAGKISTKSQGGATVTNNGDGSFTISGNGILTEKFSNLLVLTGTEARDLIGVPTMISIDAITKTLPFYVITISGAGGKVELNNSGYTMPVTVAANMIAAEDYTIQFGFFGASGKDIIPGTIKPMINAGNAAKPWEPYTGGRPAPSPEYSQPLDVTVTGENQLDVSTIVKGMVSTDTGIMNDSQIFLATDYIPVKEGNYILSGRTGITSYFNHAVLFDRDKKLVGSFSMIANKGLLVVPEGCAYVRIRFIAKNYQSDNANITIEEIKELDPMFNYGNTAMPYQPYAGYQTSSITLKEPLHGVGNYRDRITQTKRISRCIELTFSGSENWTIHNNKDYPGFLLPECLPEYMNKRAGICNQAIADTVATDKPDRLWIGSSGSRNLFVVNSSFYDAAAVDKGLSAWKTHLSAYPLRVVTYLETPVEIELPAATQSALSALTTYQGRTTVTITAGGPEPDVELEYVQDTRAVIADLQKQIDEIRNGGTNE